MTNGETYTEALQAVRAGQEEHGRLLATLIERVNGVKDDVGDVRDEVIANRGLHADHTKRMAAHEERLMKLETRQTIIGSGAAAAAIGAIGAVIKSIFGQ